MTETKRTLTEIPLADIDPDVNQPRKIMDKNALNDLSKSIEKHGIIQPIIVRDGGNGKYIIVAGERRYQAAKLAGRTTIPALTTTGEPAEIALVENLLREDLTPLEEARAMERLKKEAGYNNQKIADFLGKAESTVSETLKILSLPDSIIKEIDGGRVVQKRILVAIARIGDAKKQSVLWRSYKKNDIGRDDITKNAAADDDKRKDKFNVFTRFLNASNNKFDSFDAGKLDDEQREELIKILIILKENAIKAINELSPK
ncbi:MAG: ParB/RepB/Spo0J family partition protein [Magnetococcales bacterium]|nr:ParB/RepB/Spo0J family partition protein [Magnetococcales bacterium]